MAQATVFVTVLVLYWLKYQFELFVAVGLVLSWCGRDSSYHVSKVTQSGLHQELRVTEARIDLHMGQLKLRLVVHFIDKLHGTLH